ncbi:MAG: phytanoyl-CoA dioxygenase family protein [Anaerolineae bacterium]|nr:phytanoyl-CoA dioxygenase family protein [Anaerolineae bacterium]
MAAEHFDGLPTDADVAFYRENGYWLGPKILSDDALAALLEHQWRVIKGKYESGRPPTGRNIEPDVPVDRLVKIDNSYWCDATIARLAVNPIIGAMAARLTGAKAIRLWHDQLLYKPPQTGGAGVVGWHQDYHYWQCAAPAEMITAWVALTDVDESNGCMEVVPGSHRWGLQPEGDFFNQDLEALQQRIEATSGRALETAPCILPAGAVSFHHCLTFHGSRPNLSDRPRRSFAIHLMPDGTRYRAGTPSEAHNCVALLSGKDGDPFAGPYFPVLYREGGDGNPWEVTA